MAISWLPPARPVPRLVVCSCAGLSWYRKAAEQGHTDAQFLLACFYEEGRGGLSKDDDAEKDFAPITMVASAAPRVPADTVRDFVEAARASPQTLANYGSAGTGTVFHLTGELFKQVAGLQLQHVPYRGGAPTVTALLAGEIPLAFETMLALQPHVRAGTLRALAVTSTRPSAIMPEIPTSAEAGFPALVANNSYALFAPAGTPTPILTRLHDPTVAALASPEVRDQLREQGAEVIGSSPAELATYVAAEIPKWAALARQAGVKP
jgi:tripartite-type tricarboxylate transporter receptor subunit TctC